MKSDIKTKIVAAVLCLTLVAGSAAFGTVLAYQESAFLDTAGHWAAESIDYWAYNGILNGYEDGTFRPENSVKRSEFAAMLNRVAGFPAAAENFSDVSSSDWYAADLGALQAAGIMQGSNGNAMPNSTVTREQAVAMLARAFRLEQSGEPGYDDSSDIAVTGNFRGAVAVMSRKGYISGVSDNLFRPKDNLTRAELAAMLSLIAPNFAGGASIAQVSEGNLFLTQPDSEINLLNIDGDIIIAPSAGSSNALFDRVMATGTLYPLGALGGVRIQSTFITAVRATEDNTNILLDRALVKRIDIKGADSKLSVTENTVADYIVVSGAGTELDITMPQEVGVVEISAPGVRLYADGSTVIKNLVLREGATGFVMSGAGVVENAYIYVSDAELSTTPASVNGSEPPVVPENPEPVVLPTPEPTVSPTVSP